MILSLTDVSALKKEFADRFSEELHFCDACGGQSFTIENPTKEMQEFVSAYFAAKNLKAVFSESGERFCVKKNF